jgi:hypothetical protein
LAWIFAPVKRARSERRDPSAGRQNSHGITTFICAMAVSANIRQVRVTLESF